MYIVSFVVRTGIDLNRFLISDKAILSHIFINFNVAEIYLMNRACRKLDIVYSWTAAL